MIKILIKLTLEIYASNKTHVYRKLNKSIIIAIFFIEQFLCLKEIFVKIQVAYTRCVKTKYLTISALRLIKILFVA